MEQAKKKRRRNRKKSRGGEGKKGECGGKGMIKEGEKQAKKRC